MKRMTWIVVGWLVLGVSAQAASFDCAKAQSKVEHLICDNPEISKLDEELNAAYKAALQDEKQADTTMQAQKQWMKERNGCADADCVTRSYESRLKAIPSSLGNPVSNPKQKPRFSVTKGEGHSVCESYARFLNSLPEGDAYPVCHPKLSPDFPDLKEPDWEVIDIPTHMELVYGIEKILSPSYHDRPVDTLDHWKAVYEQQIRDGEATPRLRRVHLALTEDGPMETILAYEPDREACAKKAKEKGYIFSAAHTSLFLWSEQAQKIQQYTNSLAFAGVPSELFLFQGVPITFWTWWNLPKGNSVSGYVDVRHFKQVGTEPYANLFSCRIGFEIQRESYERMIK